MGNYRDIIEKKMLRALCWLTSNKSMIAPFPNLHQVQVLGGPIKGMYFSMPRLERLAFGLGSYEQDIVKHLQFYIKPGDVVYDVGANAGYLTLVMAQLVGKQGQVFAFEPDPKNFLALTTNIKSNRLSHVTPVDQAVSHQCDTVRFATFDYSLVGHIMESDTPTDATIIEVPSVSLDHYVYQENHPAPTFIKIDVEGGEENVLLGAQKLLQDPERKPIVLAEVREGQMWDKVSQLMQNHGYTCHVIDGGWQVEQDGLGDVLFLPN